MYRLLGAVLVLAGIGILYLAASGDRSARNDPAAATVPPMARTALPVARDMASAPADRTLLISDLQRELKRVGCYEGEIDGVWTRSTRDAMERFTELANAKLPTHEPDIILLSLVRGYARVGCDRSVITSAPPPAPPPRAPPLEGYMALAGPQAEAPAPGTAPHRHNRRASEPPRNRQIDSDWIGELWKGPAY